MPICGARLTLAGADLLNALKQASEFHLAPAQYLATPITYLSDVNAAGLDVAHDLTFMQSWYWDLNDQTRAKALMPLLLLPFWTKLGIGLLRRFETPVPTQRWDLSSAISTSEAGLSDLHLEADRFIGGGADWGGYADLAGLVKSVLPFLETSGITTAKEVAPDTLESDSVRTLSVVMALLFG